MATSQYRTVSAATYVSSANKTRAVIVTTTASAVPATTIRSASTNSSLSGGTYMPRR